MSDIRHEAARAALEALAGQAPDELLLDRLFAAAPVGLGFVDREHRYVRVNEALARMNQRPVADHLGRTPIEVLGEPGHQLEALLERTMVTGEALTDLEAATPDGRHFTAAFAPVIAGKTTLGALAVVQEVTDRKRTELDLARALDHSTRLQQVAGSLSAALTVDEVAGIVVRAAMDVFGATCGVLALRTGNHLEVAHRYGIARGAPSIIPLDADLPMPEAMRRRRPVILGSRTEWLTRYPANPPRSAFESFIAVPMLYEGRATGCMGIGIAEARHPDEREIALLTAIGRSAAAALERARLYEERAYVASTLQSGLLPKRLPSVEGLDVAVAYRPVGDGSQVGGDFYDMVDLGDSWMAAVGDVCGKGAPAAVLSGLVRTTIGAVAQRGDSPSDILGVANRAIIRHSGQRSDYASAVCAILFRERDGFRAVVGSAGHPPALVLRAEGEVELVESEGMLLGVGADPRVVEREVLIGPGDTLVLHTDGVIDARVRGELFGEQRLHEVLSACAGLEAREIADRVDHEVRAFQGGPARDDAALLVLRAT